MPFATPLAAVRCRSRWRPATWPHRRLTTTASASSRVTGCLLRAGYAGYQMDGVTVDAIDGKPVPATLKDADGRAEEMDAAGRRQPGAARRRKGAGRRTIGLEGRRRSSSPDEPPKPPSLEVKSLKTLAASCS